MTDRDRQDKNHVCEDVAHWVTTFEKSTALQMAVFTFRH